MWAFEIALLKANQIEKNNIKFQNKYIIIIIIIFIQDTHVTEVFFSGVLHYKFQLQYIYITK
jgi:hypothetical protein